MTNIVDPYVIVEVQGVAADCDAQSTLVHHDGFNPVFDESFDFPVRINPKSCIHILAYLLCFMVLFCLD